MKTIYLIKSLLPFVFLPIAPGVLQMELERIGFLAPTGGAFISIAMQLGFSILIIAWLAYAVNRKQDSVKKEFVKMSSLSKKVFHDGEWVTVEEYLDKCHNIVVSHGLTPEECEAWIRESEAYLGFELPDAKTKLMPAATIAVAD